MRDIEFRFSFKSCSVCFVNAFWLKLITFSIGSDWNRVVFFNCWPNFFSVLICLLCSLSPWWSPYVDFGCLMEWSSFECFWIVLVSITYLICWFFCILCWLVGLFFWVFISCCNYVIWDFKVSSSFYNVGKLDLDGNFPLVLLIFRALLSNSK